MAVQVGNLVFLVHRSRLSYQQLIVKDLWNKKARDISYASFRSQIC